MGASKTWTNSPGRGPRASNTSELGGNRGQFEYEDHPFQPGIAGVREVAGSSESGMADVSFARLTTIRLDRDLRQFRRERELPRSSAH